MHLVSIIGLLGLSGESVGERNAGPDILADIHSQVETVIKWKVVHDFRPNKWQQLSLWAWKVETKTNIQWIPAMV